ncbi:MAG: glycosyltransferase family 2 protein [Nanoarchaeota archaeon]|nr:glycosyltransferase family 2 protein [Nanoarchaeota archaeon]
MNIVVCIPAYNEEKTLPDVITSIKKIVSESSDDYSFLVVDDGSSDKTVEVSKKLGARVVSHPSNYGLAETFRTEMKEVLKLSPDIILHIDADGQYLAKDIPLLIEPVKRGKADLVLGSRFAGHIESMPWLKRFGNKAFSRVISSIVRQKISDGQTGFRAFVPAVAKIDILSDFTYTQEQIIRSAREHFRIMEVPVHFARRDGESRLMKNAFHYAARAWIGILRIQRDYLPLKFFGAVGGFFVFLGLALGIFILYSWITTDAVGGIPRVILSALFIMTGIQIVLFGFLADMRKR